MGNSSCKPDCTPDCVPEDDARELLTNLDPKENRFNPNLITKRIRTFKFGGELYLVTSKINGERMSMSKTIFNENSNLTKNKIQKTQILKTQTNNHIYKLIIFSIFTTKIKNIDTQ